MKSQNSLLIFLQQVFRVSEFFVVLTLIEALFLFPHAASLVASGHGNVAFFVTNGTPGYILQNDSGDFDPLAFGKQSVEGMLNSDQVAPSLGYFGFGNIAFGPFRYTTEGGRQLLVLKNLNAEAVQMDSLTGMFSFIRPTNPGEILAAIQGPFLLSVFCTGAISIAILELLSRLFRRVQQDEAFTAASIQRIRVIGILFIISGLLRPLTAWWLMRRMADYALHHTATGIYLHTPFQGSFTAITTGLVVLALAELFRQGQRLKEETALTI